MTLVPEMSRVIYSAEKHENTTHRNVCNQRECWRHSSFSERLRWWLRARWGCLTVCLVLSILLALLMVALIYSRTLRPYHIIHNKEHGEKPRGGGNLKGKRSFSKENVTSRIDYLFWDSFLESKYEFKVYLFELNNYDEVYAGFRPKMSEKGPYVYNVYRRRDIIDDDPKNDEVTFREHSTFVFNKSASGKLSEQDTVTVLGAPYLNIMQWTEYPHNWPHNAFHPTVSHQLPDYLGTTKPISLETSVANILFNGIALCKPSKKHFVVSMMCEKIIRHTDILGSTKLNKDHILYAIFDRRNNTYQGNITAKKGLLNEYEAGLVTHYNSHKIMNIWLKNERDCNIVKGFLNHFPPNSNQTTILEIFLEEICRTVKLEFAGTEVVHGILGYRYVPIKSTFSNTGENDCFCIKNATNVNGKLTCLYNGVLDATRCLDTPFMMSFPHFLYVDGGYRDLILGLKPNKSKHEMYITVEPETGILLKIVIRIQYNMFLHDYKMDHFGKVKSALVPLVWVEESYILPEKYAETIIGGNKGRRWTFMDILKYVLLATALIAVVICAALIGHALS